MELIPAIMPRSFSELREALETISGLAETVQIDVMDGIFVPEKSWPYTDGDYEGFLTLAEGRDSFPQHETVDFEADLMVANPEEEILKWIRAGARRVIVHYESTASFERIISLFKDRMHEKELADAYSKPIELGVALDIKTPNELLDPWMRDVNFVQCMGIAKIGYQGQPFDERVIEKVRDFRERYPACTISVDGGVSLETAPRLIVAGANRLVAGSAIWESEDLEETIEMFRELAQK